MNYLIYIFIAIFLSSLWLVFFLSKDKNPESKKVVLNVFILGMFAAIVAGIIQTKIAGFLNIDGKRELTLFMFLFYHFIIISFVEEFMKFLTVRISIVNHSEFDEPVDIMIYMITAALGFAALENFIYLIRYEGLFGKTIYHYAIYFGFLRFIGATFLHLLSSAVVGFFMALSFLKIKKRKLFTFIGLLSGTVLHALYNLFIISDRGYNLLLSLLLIIFLAIFIIYYAFWKLKKIKSICQL